MLRFTLDTNCIIAVEKREPAAAAIEFLVAAHRQGRADVALGAISASENQRGGRIENFRDFEAWIASVGFEGLELLPTLGYWDIGYWDNFYWASDEGEKLEVDIHNILFPGRDCSAPLTESRTALNAKCDVLAMWSHIHHGRDVFVTSDLNFHAKKAGLLMLGAKEIARPSDAVAMTRLP